MIIEFEVVGQNPTEVQDKALAKARLFFGEGPDLVLRFGTGEPTVTGVDGAAVSWRFTVEASVVTPR